MTSCENGRFEGGCPTCDDPPGSQSYREFDTTYDTPEYRAWEAWLKAYDLPLTQIALKGWVARDVLRKTVSVKVFYWKPEDDAKVGFKDKAARAIVYPDRDDDGHWVSKDARYGVFTLQLESAPLPFPDMAKVSVDV